MPPLPPITNVLRLRLTGTINQQNWASIQYAKFLGPPPSSNDLGTIATSITTAWQNAIAPITNPVVHLRIVEVIDLSSDVSSTGSHAQDVPGTRTGTAFPNSVAMVASYKINRRYRGGHPRTYWPCGNNTDVTNGNIWTQTFLNLAGPAASSFVGNINAINYAGNPLQHGVVSYYTRDPQNPGHSMLRTDPIFFATQTVSVHSRVDTMRRRLGREIA